jgi:hypothetical protein
MFAIGQDPWPAVPRIRAVATKVLREPLIQMQRRAKVEFPRGLALENVCGGHFGKYGRHEETRTPDLYRVKVAL